MAQLAEARKLDAHIWQREQHEHYVEPEWVSRRLLETEVFHGAIDDPCCGFGTIPKAAESLMFSVTSGDIVYRGYDHSTTADFLQSEWARDNIVCNPPFDIFEQFAHHALRVTSGKVAMIWLVRRLNAARWLQDTPLRRVHLLTPRPSMPPGHVIASGEKPGGGTQDFCWLVWERGYSGKPELLWLRK